MDRDKDPGGFAAGREDNVGDVAGRDARVAEFAFEHGADLFAEGVGDTVAVVRSGSLFGHRSELLRIPDSDGPAAFGVAAAPAV